MAQVFYPKKAIFVPATGGHPPNAEYKISWGTEKWSNKDVYVTKVQMVYDGKVAGRISPSFPDNTLDLKAVKEALKILPSIPENHSERYIFLLKEVSPEQLDITAVEDEIDTHVTNVYMMKENPRSIMTNIAMEDPKCIDKNIYAFLSKIEIYFSK